MIVTLGAAHRQAQKDGTDGGGHFAEQDVPVLFAPGFGEGSQPEKGQGDHHFRVRRRQFAGRHHLEELVPGQLFLHEPVVGLVGIEGIDDVVPVAPGMVVLWIALIAVGVGVTGQIQPVAPPALPVARIRQQTVHQSFIGRGGGVADESLHLGRLGRQAQQVEVHPADQAPPGGGRCRRESLLLQASQNEGVDAVLDPGRTLHLGRRSGTGFGEGPIGFRRRA